MNEDINLVFCPFLPAFSYLPPEGIGYLEGSLLNKGYKPKIFDLNLKMIIDYAHYIQSEDPSFLKSIKFLNGANFSYSLDKYSKNIVNFWKNVSTLEKKSYNYFKNAYLEKAEENEFFDQFVNERMKEFRKSDSQVFGFSVMDKQVWPSLYLASLIKEETPASKIIFGGPNITMNSELYAENDFIDYLVKGRGENTIIKILKLIKSGDDPKKILTEKNETAFTSFPIFEDFDLDSYLSPERVLPLQTTNGCYYKECYFCADGKSTYFRKRQLSSIEEEIKYHNKHNNCTHFDFVDLCTPPQVLDSINNSSQNLDIKFATELRLERKFNDIDFLEEMNESGLRLVRWGLESGSKKTLNLMNKGIDLEVASDIFEKSPFWNHVFLIFNFPLSENHKKTIDFVENSNIHSISIAEFLLEKNTYVFNNPEKFGIEIKGKKDHYSSYYKFSSNDRKIDTDKIEFKNVLYKLNNYRLDFDRLVPHILILLDEFEPNEIKEGLMNSNE